MRKQYEQFSRTNWGIKRFNSSDDVCSLEKYEIYAKKIDGDWEELKKVKEFRIFHCNKLIVRIDAEEILQFLGSFNTSTPYVDMLIKLWNFVKQTPMVPFVQNTLRTVGEYWR